MKLNIGLIKADLDKLNEGDEVEFVVYSQCGIKTEVRLERI